MHKTFNYLCWLILLSASIVAGGASAGSAKPSADEKAMREKMEMMEKMEMLEKMELSDHLDAARSCAAANNFGCAQDRLNKARGMAADRADQGKVANMQSYVNTQRNGYEEGKRRLAMEQKRKQQLDTYLATARECLSAYKLDCTKSELDKAQSQAANDAERAAIADVTNKATQLAQAIAAAGYSSGSGYSGGYAANGGPGYTAPSSSYAGNAYQPPTYQPPTYDNTPRFQQQMNTLTNQSIQNLNRQEDSNRSRR